jgi:hypothetical protein
MQTMNQSLLHLVAHGALDREIAEIRSPEPDEFRQMLVNLDRKGYQQAIRNGACFGFPPDFYYC